MASIGAFSEELWAALAKAAKEFDVQIFATTHSRDCIGGFVSASKELGIEDAKLYRLEREGDEIYAVDLALINVEDALELNGKFARHGHAAGATNNCRNLNLCCLSRAGTTKTRSFSFCVLRYGADPHLKFSIAEGMMVC
jgi:hypothetical protein